MRIALVLRDREVAGETQPVYIQLCNMTRCKRYYYQYLEHCGILNEEILEEATAILESGGSADKEDMPRVILIDESRDGNGTAEVC